MSEVEQTPLMAAPGTGTTPLTPVDGGPVEYVTDPAEVAKTLAVEPKPLPAFDVILLDKTVSGYHAAKPLGVLLTDLCKEAGVPVGNIPSGDEPVISFLRADGEALRFHLRNLERITGGKYAIGTTGLDFTLEG